jgi:FG-GAP repeat
MKKSFYSLIFSLLTLGTFAQSATIDPNYVQIPKVSALPGCVVTDKGKTVYNNTDNKMYYCNGTAWQSMTPAASAGPGWSQTGADISNTNAGNVGVKTATAPLTALDLGGDLSLRTGALTLVAGLNNDVDINTDKKAVYKIAGAGLTGGAQISGFTGGIDGRIITIFNNSTTNAIQLYDESNATNLSTATNKILTGTGQSAVIYGNGSATLRYDGSKQRWTIMSSNYVDGLSTVATTVVPSTAGVAGYGSWGDCATNANLSDYNPVLPDDAINFDQVGQSVSISGDYAAVGATNAVYIYKLNATISVWEQVQKISGTVNTFFGFSVAIHNDQLVVGAYRDGPLANQGSASIYQNISGVWTFQTKLFHALPGANDFFGYSVAIHGDNILVGAMLDTDAAGFGQGSASFYRKIAGVWQHQIRFLSVGANLNENFGSSVSINGDYAIVGAKGDNGAMLAGTNRGSASIYKNVLGTWQFQNQIFNTNANDGQFFGNSVSIYGDYAIVGAYGEAVSGLNAGTATIFKNNAGIWQDQYKFNSYNSIAQINRFGYNVAISGDYVIVGDTFDWPLYLYGKSSSTILKRLGTSWKVIQTFNEPNPFNNNDQFGYSTAIDATSKRFIIGSPRSNFNTKGQATFGKIK